MQYLRYLAIIVALVSIWAVASCVPVTRHIEPSKTPTPPIQTPAETAPTPPEAPGPLSGRTGWQPVFTEDFDVDRLDTGKWTRCYWWDDNGCTNLGNQNLQWYTPSGIVIEDGVLALTARDQPTRGIGGRMFPYNSGLITTGRYYAEHTRADRFAFTYGYVEVRARIPEGQGLWPAIWLLPSTQRSLPEIDIMEVLGHRPNVLEMHFHYSENSSSSRQTANKRVTVANLAEDYHVYGLEWSPQAIIWYLDGVERWRFTDTAAIPRDPMYLIINLAVGGAWPGAPDESTEFPARFLIDYVRIWQRGSQ